MKVLIIDDDKLVSLSLKTILEASGQVEIAGIGNSGGEAVELYDSLAPDILLMDIRMEGMTGLEAGVHILSAHPEAKILFLTTFSDDEYIVKALKMGAKGYILKQNFESILPAPLAVEGGQNDLTGSRGAEQPGDRGKTLSQRGYGPQLSQQYSGKAGTAGPDPAGCILL